MTNPKVSVIIPVYNTEQYVSEALMSIVDQTLKDIEIIVINDGSTDNSLRIVCKIAENDSRIQIFSQKNQGQSVARNFGIDKAKGEYIYFMDSDDLLDLNTFECCYNKCVKEKLDFAFFDADVIRESEGVSFCLDYHRPEIEEKVYNGIELLNKLIDKNIYRVAPWMNFIRLGFLQQAGLKFYPGIIHEDELFSAILYIEAEKVGRIGKNFFKRRLRGNSTMTKSFSSKNVTGYMTVFSELKSYSINKDFKIKIIIEKLLYAIINPFIYNARTLAAEERINLFISCIKNGYIKYITAKNITILFFPFFVNIKALLKK